LLTSCPSNTLSDILAGSRALKPADMWRTQWWNERASMVFSRPAMLYECAVKEWYSWVANIREGTVFVRTAYFWIELQATGLAVLSKFACGGVDRSRHRIEAWSAAIRAAFKVRRLPLCAVPQGSVLHILLLLQHRAFLPSFHTFASSRHLLSNLLNQRCSSSRRRLTSNLPLRRSFAVDQGF
jgi:hypothetical protein